MLKYTDVKMETVSVPDMEYQIIVKATAKIEDESGRVYGFLYTDGAVVNGFSPNNGDYTFNELNKLAELASMLNPTIQNRQLIDIKIKEHLKCQKKS